MSEAYNHQPNGAKNPFDHDIVRDPREIDIPVESVNARALNHLVDAFTEAETLKRDRAPSTQVVLSEPGYGKSHLLGRLFRRLDQRATHIYLRPFQDPQSCWTQILEKVIQELDRPASPDKMCLGPDDQSQLTVVTRKVLESLAGELIFDGILPPANVPPGSSVQQHTEVWNQWMDQHFDRMLADLDGRLKRKGIYPSPNRKAWLKVLYAYAFPQDSSIGDLCLDWLQGQPLDDNERKKLGLRQADIPPYEPSCAGRNEASFLRLRDILQFASFYRPFLFCVDQTELYQTSQELANTLGIVLSRLNRECVNHLVVVTGNQMVWKEKVATHFEQADLHVLTKSPVTMVGVDRQQAEELLDQRLRSINKAFSPQLAHWLDDLFATRKRIGPREILQQASRWWGQKRPRHLEEIFDEYRNKLLQNPSFTTYDTGVFQWAAEYVLGSSAQAVPERIQTQRGYLTLRLNGPDSRCYFGFESGSHWRRWQAILEETRRYYEQEKHEHRGAQAVFFRTPDQRPLPDRNQQMIDQSPFVRIFTLTQEETADFFAAHDFYVGVLQGDHQGIKEQDLRRFLVERFAKWHQRIHSDKIELQPDLQTHSLEEVISQAVRNFHIVNISQVLQHLKRIGMDIQEDNLLRIAQKTKKIKVWESPESKVFQWIPSP